MRPPLRLTGILASLLVGAGCLGPAGLPPADGLPEGLDGHRPVVVALIDTGINPYHEAFRAPPGSGVDRLVPSLVDAEVLSLAESGKFEERNEADAPLWDGLETGRLYAFAGTRVLAMSFAAPPDGPLVLDAALPHGTGTAGMVAREAPEAIVVMLQVDADTCNTGRLQECRAFMEAAAPLAWAAEQPWIDVISMSFAYAGNPPYPSAGNPDIAAFVEASRLAHDRGKILVSSAGNALVPSLGSQFSGPPWLIAVGGAQAANRGEATESSRATDVVANYTEYAPVPDSVSDYGWTSGTSYGTPLVAGTLAHAISLVRAGGGPWQAPTRDVRDALNATAVHFAPTDYDPTAQPTNDTLTNAYTRSLPVLVPFAQMGWGYVHGGMADEIARRVLAKDLAPPPEKATTAQYQAEWQSAREAYWAHAT